MNHLGKLCEFFLIKDPDPSIKQILQSDILFRLIIYFEYPQIQNFYVKLLGIGKYNFLPFQEKIYLYLNKFHFFEELGKLLLFNHVDLEEVLFRINYELKKKRKNSRKR